jgi:hypothetical protein
MRLLALTRPAEFFSLFADRDLYKFDEDLDQYLYNNRYRLDANGVVPPLTNFTVETLPSAESSGAGARAFVTDALSPTFGATVATGGAVAVPVYSDGTNWKVG